jgi:hypothetical protein
LSSASPSYSTTFAGIDASLASGVDIAPSASADSTANASTATTTAAALDAAHDASGFELDGEDPAAVPHKLSIALAVRSAAASMRSVPYGSNSSRSGRDNGRSLTRQDSFNDPDATDPVL